MHLAPYVSDQHLHAPQPDECMCRYRCHPYCSAEQMWTMVVGPCAETTSCYAHLSCLACISISRYYRCCGWAGRLQTRVLRNDRRCVIAIAIPCATCRRTRPLKICGFRILTNCGKVRGFGCELGIRNNTNNKNYMIVSVNTFHIQCLIRPTDQTVNIVFVCNC